MRNCWDLLSTWAKIVWWGYRGFHNCIAIADRFTARWDICVQRWALLISRVFLFYGVKMYFTAASFGWTFHGCAHYSDFIMSVMASQITGVSIVYLNRLAQIKENIKAPHHWPLWGNSPVSGWIHAQRANNAENGPIWWRHLDLCDFCDHVFSWVFFGGVVLFCFCLFFFWGGGVAFRKNVYLSFNNIECGWNLIRKSLHKGQYLACLRMGIGKVFGTLQHCLTFHK